MKPNKLFLLLLMIMLAGCASVLNPFQSEFKCNEVYEGECIPLDKAYKYALTVNGNEESAASDENQKEKQEEGQNAGKANNTVSPQLVVTGRSDNLDRDIYRDSIYRSVSQLLEEPKKPIVVPPKVVRVLILPYKDESNNLLMHRYMYFFASEPEWVFDIPEKTHDK